MSCILRLGTFLRDAIERFDCDLECDEAPTIFLSLLEIETSSGSEEESLARKELAREIGFTTPKSP